jgi:hypothetical protein
VINNSGIFVTNIAETHMLSLVLVLGLCMSHSLAHEVEPLRKAEDAVTAKHLGLSFFDGRISACPLKANEFQLEK